MSRRISGRNVSRIAHLVRPFGALEQLEARCMLTGSPYADRGWVSVIVDHTIAQDLAPKLEKFKRDLVGDGWTVAPNTMTVNHNGAPRMNDEFYVWNNTARVPVNLDFDADKHNLDQYKIDLQAVKDIIEADRLAAINAGSTLKQIILVGHVTVPYSGAPGGDGNPYNGHNTSAATSDSYYGDLDGTPLSWRDRETWTADGNTVHYECTTNEIGDGRFDTMTVPGNALVFTITGTEGTFQFHYSDVNSTDEEDTHEYSSVTLPAGASADTVREAIDGMLSPLDGACVSVIKDGDSYTVRLLDATGVTVGYEQTLTATVGGGLSVSSDELQTGGLECAVGRIDMANLDSAFPLEDEENEPLTNTQIERILLNRYFEKDHDWRTGEIEIETEKALIDQTTEDLDEPSPADGYAFTMART